MTGVEKIKQYLYDHRGGYITNLTARVDIISKVPLNRCNILIDITKVTKQEYRREGKKLIRLNSLLVSRGNKVQLFHELALGIRIDSKLYLFTNYEVIGVSKWNNIQILNYSILCEEVYKSSRSSEEKIF